MALSRASAPIFGTSDQCPPTTRLSRPGCASRLSPRSWPSPGAAAKTSVRLEGCRVSRKRRSRARISSSGVPMPTNPELHTVSPSRITATASSGETILLLNMPGSRVFVVLGQPVGDARTQKPLRLAAHEHAHMPARQRELLVGLAADAEPERLGGGGWDDVVVLGEDVQHRHGNGLQIDLAPAQLQLAFDELVVLVEVLEPLLGGLARMVRAVGDPLLHAQEVEELLLVVHDLDEVEVVLRERAHRRHHREHRAHELAGQVAVRLDQAVDVLGLKAAGPEIDEPEPK